ncbi:MAG: carboxypeptidase regulatory-like domain-containing protein, partial [Planctomycetota bacterium]
MLPTTRQCLLLAAALLIVAAPVTTAQDPADTDPNQVAMHGTVVDAEGKPVADAIVRMVALSEEWSFEQHYECVGPADVRTAADGTFTLAPVPTDRARISVRVVPTGGWLAVRSRDFPVGRRLRGTIEVGTIQLQRPRTVSGKVVDADGNPIEGVRVFRGIPRAHEPLQDPEELQQMMQQQGGMWIGGGIMITRESMESVEAEEQYGTGAGSIWPRMRSEAVTTGADGTFTLDRMVPGTDKVSFRKRGCLDSTLNPLAIPADADVSDLTVTLQQSPTLALLFRDADLQPIVGAIAATQNYRYDGNDYRRFISDAGGNITIEDMFARKVHVTAVAEGFMMIDRDFDLADTGDDLVIRQIDMVREGVIKGVVVDDDGDAVPGVMVSFSASGARTMRHHGGAAITGDDGSFEIRGLDAATYTVSLMHPEFKEFSSEARELAAGETLDLGSLQLHRLSAEELAGATIRITVVDSAGNPVTDVRAVIDQNSRTWVETGGIRRLVAYSDDDFGGRFGRNFGMGRRQASGSARTNDKGVAEISGLPDGEVRVELQREPGIVVGEIAKVTATIGKPVDVRVVLQDLATIRGVARDADGKPIAGAAIGLVGNRWHYEVLSMLSDKDGAFCFTDVLPGTYRMSTTLDPEDRFRRGETGPAFTVAAGATVERDATPPRQFRVVGTIKQADGTPLVGAHVTTRANINRDLDEADSEIPELSYPRGDALTNERGAFTLNQCWESTAWVLEIQLGDKTYYARFDPIIGEPRDIRADVTIPAAATEQTGATICLHLSPAKEGEGDDAPTTPLASPTVRLRMVDVPIGGVLVDETAAITASGSGNNASLDWTSAMLRPGSYQLEVRSATRATERRMVTIEAGKPVTLDIAMYREARLTVKIELP